MIDIESLRGVMRAGPVKSIEEEHRTDREFTVTFTLHFDDGTRLVITAEDGLDATHEGTPRCKACNGSGWIDPNGEYGNPSPCRECNAPQYRIPRP